ncbi:unnamed protein product [Symbiodinium natans]|uniref:S1 motif domain-containing protein n=1 Tax=Symbiodinium natans TaxID=878477 RepID=A0A812I170_9DINO|nr:unnamed protein product [Symbiodinium natans]
MAASAAMDMLSAAPLWRTLPCGHSWQPSQELVSRSRQDDPERQWKPAKSGLCLGGAALLGASCKKRSRVSLQVRRRQLPIVREKEVIATKRLPLWQLSDEMYMERQLAPDPNLSWTEVRRAQARMKEQVIAQQFRDFKKIERELGGFRLQPQYHISELRAGMWLEGRVSATHDKGVLVDVGAYTESGEWVDGFLHMGQIKDDGGYVRQDKIMNFVHLGESVRVRVVECVPATGLLRLSMRLEEDLPELFMGKPRPYSIHDIEQGMKVTGIVRRVWDKWALVDIGCDCLARLHVREHPRERNEYGFYKWDRLHKYAWSAFTRGAQLELWVEKIKYQRQITLVGNKPPSAKMADKVKAARMTGAQFVKGLDRGEERMTLEQQRDREKSEAEKAHWSPYVPHVDEWLEEAAEPDEETDSWVARTEREIFEEFREENGETSAQEGIELASNFVEEEFDEADDFGEDEFAEDDFADDSSYVADDVPFSLGAPGFEDDAWELNDGPESSQDDSLLY